MLVMGDGSVVCELSGGCPQRDIVARAQEVMANGETRLVRYDSESGLDVLMEMGCGGELEVLIEPLTAPHALDFAGSLLHCLEARQPARLATFFALDGSPVTPRRQLSTARETVFDALADPALSKAVAAATAAQAASTATVVSLSTPHGVADVLIESADPRHALVVVGSSAAALALLPVASALGWQTTLVDHDPERLRALQLPARLHAICATPDQLIGAISLDQHSSVVVMTHNLERDLAYLAALSDAPVAYVGALGSRERATRMRSNPQLDRLQLHAPAGLDIGSETPQEIALAVAAEIMAVINRRGGGPLRDNEGTIH